jgi:hypothetical protein
MMALSLFAIISTAITSLMYATTNLNRQTQKQATGSSETELALRRMIEVTRCCTSLTYVSVTNTLTLVTPADSSSKTYTYTYYLSNGALRETVVYGATQLQDVAILPNVTAFSVTWANSPTTPRCYQITLTTNLTNPATTRTVQVTGRNLTS